MYIQDSLVDDQELEKLLRQYLDPPVDPNPATENVVIEWQEMDRGEGRDKLSHHSVTREEVEEVLLEVPPAVQAKRHADYPDRTLFWGSTRHDRWLFVVCADYRDELGERHLRVITAFEPDDGEAYWNRQ